MVVPFSALNQRVRSHVEQPCVRRRYRARRTLSTEQVIGRGRLQAHRREAVRLLGVKRLLLAYATERAGTFEPLRFVRPDTVVVPGLVNNKVPALA